MKFTKIKPEEPQIKVRMTFSDGLTRATSEQLIEMQTLANETGYTADYLKEYFFKLGVFDLENITWFQWKHLMDLMKRFPRK